MDFCDLLSSLLSKAVKWYYIGLALGLSADKLDKIKANSDDVDECLRKVLQMWHSRTPHPTWEVVIAALKSPLVEDPALARELEGKTRKTAGASSIGKTAGASGIHMANLSKIKGIFATLVGKVAAKLEERSKDINLTRFRLHIKYIFGNVIKGTSSVSEIMEDITSRQLWDYSFCTHIEGLAREFGGDDVELINGWIKDYRIELGGFKATTKIVDCIQECNEGGEIAVSDESLQDIARYDKEYCKKLSIKIKSPVIKKKSLDYIDDFWRSIADHCLLPSLSAHLDSIHEGCVEVTWLIPTQSALQIQTCIQDSTEFLEKLEVIRVTINCEILYDVEKLLAPQEGSFKDTNDHNWGESDTPFPDSQVATIATLGQGYRSQMHPTKDPSKRERTLQEILVQAVLFGHLKAVEQAAAALNEHFVKNVKSSTTPKTTGPLQLDFIIEKRGWSKVPAKHKLLCMSHSPLMMALEVGQDEAAKKLIDLGASVGFKNKDGLTALHIACNKGKAEIVELLLKSAEEQKRFCQKKGAKKDSDCEVVINAKERPQGWTPLMYAVKGGHTAVQDLLMEYDFLRYDIENKKKQNVCHIAAREGKMECLEKLHDKLKIYDDLSLFLTADKKNWNLLHQVCCCGDVETFKWLLETIPAFKTRDYLNQRSHEYRSKPSTTDLCYTPLLVACDYQKIGIVQELASLGADLVDFAACCHSSKTEDGCGFTGLHIAAIHDAEDIAQLLIDADCPLDVVDEKGNTALHVASSRLSDSVVALITEKGGSLIRNKEGDLPSEVKKEIIIPPEIRKRGLVAIKIYRRALDEGKTKIPYCSLLILGKEEVGKTSLYRQLVGKEFLKTTDPTDQTTVAVDRRSVTVNRETKDNTKDKWQEKEMDDSNEQFSDALASRVMEDLPEKPSEKSDQLVVVKEADLLHDLSRITREIPIHVNPPPVRREVPPPPLPPPPPQPKPPKDRVKPSQAAVPLAPMPVANRPLPQPCARKQPAKMKEPTGMVNTRERSKVNEIVKGNQKHKKLQLEFNTLDFSGQQCYRPMHHCFISRRAMYMVVFKIPDMLEKKSDNPATTCSDPTVATCSDPTVATCSDPIVDIRYWINSIHAHIYPPDEEDKQIHRVFLVGTHRNGHTSADLEKINRSLTMKLIDCDDNRPVSHIHCREAPEPNFFPVENSTDVNSGDNYLEASGTKDLKDAVMSKDLPFLNEDYPIKWLKFEEHLKLCRKARKVTPVATIEEVKKLAVKCNITDDSQDLALKFFHDTGKIIYLRDHPGLKLFLKKKECEQLENFIVLSPHWLMLVMKEIMELDLGKNTGYDSKIKTLVKDGVTDMKLFEVCWKDHVSKSPVSSQSEQSPCIQLHHLCWILQANCLIYPITDEVDVATSDTADADTAQKYMIPCKLPPDFRVENRLPPTIKNFATFFFDCGQFLLDKLYHRLICLATAKSKPGEFCNQYSSKKCNFFGLEGTNWVMEIEEDKQRLKIKVVIKDDTKCTPVDYMNIIHKDYLFRICSGLKGLAYNYHGGPEITCDGCKDEKVKILRCVKYSNGKEESSSTADYICGQCGKKFDANKEMRPSPDASESTTLGVNDLKDVLTAVKPVAAKWDMLALNLHLKRERINFYKGHTNPLMEILTEWLNGNGGERNWEFLSEAVRHRLVGHPDLADKIGKKKL